MKKQRFTIALNPETKAKAAEVAEAKGISLSSMIEMLLREKIKKEPKK